MRLNPVDLIARCLFVSLLVAGVFAATGCGSGSGDDGDDDGIDQGDPDDAGSPGSGQSFTTDCGTVLNGALVNPVRSSDGFFATSVTAITSSLFVLNGPQGPQLVKLLGLSIEEGDTGAARDVAISLVSGGAYFFPASSTCAFTAPGGGQGTQGQLISASGVSIAEAVIKSGTSTAVEASGGCGESLIGGCYQALFDAAIPPVPPSIGEIRDFLWKPKSEGGYNPGLLSILVDACDVRVLVNEDELPDFGGTNGRCTTARSTTKSGCDYGSNVKVQVLDRSTGAPYLFPGDVTEYIIPNGCSRVEFKR